MAKPDPTPEQEPNRQPIIGIVTPLEPVDPPAQAAFDDHGAIAGEPATDRKLELEDGTILRERMVPIAEMTEGVQSTASPTMVSFAVSNALLDDAGKVTMDRDGRPMISTRHEIVLTAEAMGRLGTPKAVDEAIKREREVAAAKAQGEFLGLQLLDRLRASRQ